MIDLRTLGTVELTSPEGASEGATSVLAQPRRAALLCYLALASPRGFHRRDTLFALFWPEYDAAQARHALRQAVYFLRRALGSEAIVSRGDEELALDPAQVRCDAWEFEAALDDGRTAEALALYKGELLAGFHVSDAPEFERWLDGERGRLRERAEEAGWNLAALRQQGGDSAGAAEAARRAVALAPTDEVALRRLVLLLESIGDRAGAVRAYEAFTRKLWQEYELEPSAETQVLVARIRGERAEPPKVAESAEQSPPAPAPVVASSVRATPGRKLVTAGAIAAVLLLVSAFLLRRWSPDAAVATGELPAGDSAPAIAVLPFALQDQSLATWREGLMDLIAMDLSDVPGIRTVDNRAVLARWRERVPGQEAPELATALDVAERAGGKYVVVGNVIADGSDLLLTAGVHEVAGRRMLGTARSRGSADSIFALVDRLSLEILRLLPGNDAREHARIDLARVNTTSLPALKAFLEGEVLYRRSQFERAAEAYGRAVDADSTFPLARYRLGLARQWFWSDLGGGGSDPLAPAVGAFADRLPHHEAAMLRAFELRSSDVLAARDLLKEELRRHPDDADSWFQLGEFYVHSGAEIPVTPGDADHALAKAMSFDSTFSLPYVHRIEYAVGQRDTVEVKRMLTQFARLAPGTQHLDQLRLLAGLVVGDSAARSQSAATIDTLEISRVLWLGFQLATAHRWDLSEQLFRVARARPEHPPVAAIALFFTMVAQGRGGEARQSLTDPYALPSRRPRMLYALSEIGRLPSSAELDAILPRTAADSADALQLFYIGVLAAGQERWQLVKTMQEQLGSLTMSGDTSHLVQKKAIRQALDGYVEWRQGRREEGLRLIQLAQRQAHGGQGINDVLRWWLGQLHLELGHQQEAVRYFESLAGSWLPADYERARLYQQLGMTSRAREAYQYFIAPRQRADSVLRPMVEDARQALGRLPAGDS